jgi:hypothetical protein
MAHHHTDIVIIGGGIAGLWTLARLKASGFDCLLIENKVLGGGQSIASQGIIHSGLKYTLAGKVNSLAKSISAMPDRWRAALNGTGEIDLRQARIAANSQQLLIPSGLLGGITKVVTQQILGRGAHVIPQDQWPDGLKENGFHGSVIHMGEPVLDIPSVISAIAEQHKDCIKNLDSGFRRDDTGHVVMDCNGDTITAQKFIFTAASSNHDIAKSLGHDDGLETQIRPLLMGIMKNAPFPLYAHFVGASDKPVATITTHQTQDGNLIWYLGGQVAERNKESPPETVYTAIKTAFEKYLPKLKTSNLEFSVLPIDRIEGKSAAQGWLPDTPTIHECGNALYCWPTKLTFAPLLGDMIIERLRRDNIHPSGKHSDFEFLSQADLAKTPWN